MAEPALAYRDYTVGWICALEVEQAAARALLDLYARASLYARAGLYACASLYIRTSLYARTSP
jgi:hypothetical protein